jgi:hypothetical protein
MFFYNYSWMSNTLFVSKNDRAMLGVITVLIAVLTTDTMINTVADFLAAQLVSNLGTFYSLLHNRWNLSIFHFAICKRKDNIHVLEIKVYQISVCCGLFDAIFITGLDFCPSCSSPDRIELFNIYLGCSNSR